MARERSHSSGASTSGSSSDDGAEPTKLRVGEGDADSSRTPGADEARPAGAASPTGASDTAYETTGVTFEQIRRALSENPDLLSAVQTRFPSEAPAQQNKINWGRVIFYSAIAATTLGIVGATALALAPTATLAQLPYAGSALANAGVYLANAGTQLATWSTSTALPFVMETSKQAGTWIMSTAYPLTIGFGKQAIAWGSSTALPFVMNNVVPTLWNQTAGVIAAGVTGSIAGTYAAIKSKGTVGKVLGATTAVASAIGTIAALELTGATPIVATIAGTKFWQNLVAQNAEQDAGMAL